MHKDQTFYGASTAISSDISLFFDKNCTLIFPKLNDEEKNKISVDWSGLSMQNASMIFKNKILNMSSNIHVSKDEFFDTGYLLFSSDAIT